MAKYTYEVARDKLIAGFEAGDLTGDSIIDIFRDTLTSDDGTKTTLFYSGMPTDSKEMPKYYDSNKIRNVSSTDAGKLISWIKGDFKDPDINSKFNPYAKLEDVLFDKEEP